MPRINPRDCRGKFAAKGYISFVALLLLLSLFCLVLPAKLEARGRAETGTALEARLSLVYPLGREPETLVRERMDLPASAATLFWSSYRVEAGRIEVERSGTYSLPRLISREEGSRWAVYSYRVTLNPPEGGGRRIDVSFDAEKCDAAGLQPAPFAVQEAIRSAGASSGSVRLVEISHTNGGRFRAVVALK